MALLVANLTGEKVLVIINISCLHLWDVDALQPHSPSQQGAQQSQEMVDLQSATKEDGWESFQTKPAIVAIRQCPLIGSKSFSRMTITSESDNMFGGKSFDLSSSCDCCLARFQRNKTLL